MKGLLPQAVKISFTLQADDVGPLSFIAIIKTAYGRNQFHQDNI